MDVIALLFLLVSNVYAGKEGENVGGGSESSNSYCGRPCIHILLPERDYPYTQPEERPRKRSINVKRKKI